MNLRIKMEKKYIVNYEALVYNMPACENLEILEHVFVTNLVTKEMENLIAPHKELLKANHTFCSCCVNDENNNNVYITVKNKKSLELLIEETGDEKVYRKITDIVRDKIEEIEQYLIFMTNLHIFLPVVQISICLSDKDKNHLCGYISNRPMPFRKWTWIAENINIQRRLNYHLDKRFFDEFRTHKKHTRYKLAFDYYIRSFFEFDHSSAFCLLCSAIDAITGKQGKAKERLAKYSSVLLCTPLEMKQLQKKMQFFYKLRSNFTHGKGSKITNHDEIELREYVRKFLMSYFLFWQEMDVKNEQQMLQKLDEIYLDHSLYLKYAVASYTFMTMIEEHENQPDGIFGMSMQHKYVIAQTKMLEALISPTNSNEDTKELVDK